MDRRAWRATVHLVVKSRHDGATKTSDNCVSCTAVNTALKMAAFPQKLFYSLIKMQVSGAPSRRESALPSVAPFTPRCSIFAGQTLVVIGFAGSPKTGFLAASLGSLESVSRLPE